MRETDLWARLESAVGAGYASAWAEQVVLRDLGGRTVRQALADGLACRSIWLAAWDYLGLDASVR
jgi:hypothetical protein